MHGSHFALSLLLMLCTGISSLAQEPAAPHQAFESQQEFDVARTDFLQQMIVECYREHTKDTGVAKEKSLEFLQAYADHASQPDDYQRILQLGEEALAAGSQDPHCRLFVGGSTIFKARSVANRRRMVRIANETSKSLKASGYSAYSQYFARHWQADAEYNPKQRPALVRKYSRAVVALISRQSDAHPRMIWRSIRKTFKPLKRPEQSVAVDAIAAAKNVNPWLQAMLVGQGHYDIAWSLRGNGYSSTVEKDAWEKFYEHLGKAQQAFTKAHELRPDWPEAAGELVDIAYQHNAPDQTLEYWFQQATLAQFDYWPAYSAKLNGLSPKWGGSTEKIMDFGYECAATERFDTTVPQFLLECITTCQKSGAKVIEDEATRDLAQEMCQAYIDRYLEEGRDNSYWPLERHRNFAAVFAYIGQDWETFESLSIDLNGTLNRSIFEIFSIDSNGLIGRTLVDRTVVGPAVVAALKLIEAGEVAPAELEPLVDEIKEQLSDVPQHIRSYVDSVLKLAKSVLDYESGKWSTLSYDDNFVVLKPTGRSWTGNDQAAILDSNTLSKAGLWWSYPVKGPYMVETSVTADVKSNWDALAGITCGYHPYLGQPNYSGSARNAQARHFFVRGKLKRFGVARKNEFSRVAGFSPRTTNKLRVRVWDGFALFQCNGRNYMAIQEDNFSPDGYIGIGKWNLVISEQVTEFSEIRVRKVDFENPRLMEKSDQALSYWQEWVKLYPRNGWAKQQLAVVKYNNGDLQGAVDEFEAAAAINWKLDDSRLGYCYERLRNYAKAREAYRRFLKRNPDHVEISFALARLEACCADDSVRDAGAAITRAKTLIEQGPNESSPRRVMAAAQAAAGEFQQAVRWQKLAIAADPENEALAGELAMYERQQALTFDPKVSLKTAIPGPWSTKPITTKAKPVVTRGLIARLPLDFDVQDKKGGVTESSAESILGAPGKIGSAVHFYGDHYVTAPEMHEFTVDDSFSYGGWIFPTGHDGAICSKMDDLQPHVGHCLLYQSKRLRFELLSRRNHGVVLQTDQIAQRQKWHHVFVTYDGSGTAKGTKLYLNGKRIKKFRVIRDDTPTDIRVDAPFRFGRLDTKRQFWGRLDEIRVYNRALSAKEVKQVVAFGIEELPKTVMPVDASAKQ